jgi:ribosomal protein S27AE
MEVLSVLEGMCPDCGDGRLELTVTCHPAQAANWSSVTVVERDDLAAGFIPAGTPWGQLCGMSWAETTLTLVSAKCPTCGAAHYVEQSAVSGEWRV